MPPAIVTVWAVMAAFYAATIAVTIVRCRRGPPAAAALPECSIVMPVKGAPPYLAANVEALAALAPRPREILVAVAAADDAACAALAPVAARHPGFVAVLVGEDTAFSNPKLRNVAKAYRAAQAETILFLDDNVALDPGLYRALLGALRPGVAAATAAPVGRGALGLAAEVEAATCNGYLFRIETFLGLFGGSAAFGNALAFRKRDLEAEGGLAALTEGPCEDNAASKALRRRGRLVLVPVAVARCIGRRSWREIWQRHLRWTNCGKCHDPELFLIEPMAGGLCFAVIGAFALAAAAPLAWPAGLGLAAALWYGGEALLTLACRWPFGWRTPIAWVLRDLLLPALTLTALFVNRVYWRGEAIDMRFRWPWARR
ncbi:MAG: glycosyltransferase [Rhodospirillaceae bacterium]|nr:glycosyltransferase [Rhodospirillaceae bacterium]